MFLQLGRLDQTHVLCDWVWAFRKEARASPTVLKQFADSESSYHCNTAQISTIILMLPSTTTTSIIQTLNSN